MKQSKAKSDKREVRHRRVRAKISGTAERPRFSVFRSNQHIFLQLIDDKKGATIISASDVGGKGADKKKKISKIESAEKTGKELAELAKEKKIKEVVFDRGGYKYHGRVKAAADAARKGGLKF